MTWDQVLMFASCVGIAIVGLMVLTAAINSVLDARTKRQIDLYKAGVPQHRNSWGKNPQ